ncbi:DNA-binding MarR family transcriptional regulator [Crossiella equi]|uniref:DNA-binding MarR family transcriptional regulator n=1 Tax=Crossiella equi TaxID=130796 RepID=A0ABS5AM66_9PSEU|nr:MarR family transcriptional regulator [Crossiella equi]MBP2477667.1 DNA-binding MarR family transcriptional regulator [Crossiella equi]
MSTMTLTTIHDRVLPVENLLEAAREVERELDRAVRSRGMGLGEFRALLALAVHRQPMTMTSVAEAARTSRPQLSRTMERLCERGWAHRTPEEGRGDKRQIWALLTERGLDALRAAAPAYARAVAETQERLADCQHGLAPGELNGATDLDSAGSSAAEGRGSHRRHTA